MEVHEEMHMVDDSREMYMVNEEGKNVVTLQL